MKKIIFAIAIVLTLGMTAGAQGRDSFFTWDDADNDVYRTDPELSLPGAHGYENDQNLPLGSGLFILTALGAGYAVARKRH